MLRIPRQPVIPMHDESVLAKRACRQLARFHNSQLRLQLAETGDRVELPAIAAGLLIDMLTEMAKGNSISVTSIPREMSALQAAAFLNVAQSFLKS